MVKKHNNKKQEKRISPEMIAIIGSITILIGGFFLSYNYIQSKKVMAFDYISNIFYEQNQEIIVSDGEQEVEEEEEDLGEVTNNYIGYLSIPKINLKKGFLDKRSPDNDVEKNILVVDSFFLLFVIATTTINNRKAITAINMFDDFVNSNMIFNLSIIDVFIIYLHPLKFLFFLFY